MKKLSKAKKAKLLGISRPTLDKRLKSGEPIKIPALDLERQTLAVKFSARNSHISPNDLENILEDLHDFGFLNIDGMEFKAIYWQLFIQE